MGCTIYGTVGSTGRLLRSRLGHCATSCSGRIPKGFSQSVFASMQITPSLTGQRYDKNHQSVSFSTNSGVALNAYHNLTKAMVIDGTTISSPSVKTTTFDGAEVKIFTFHGQVTSNL
ncbi:hypothetical protein [Alicyclobacillus sp. SO9]|uniref:hypothetical protein n=1 Tax=Alicyclobacillus sp. SO9 TaxID=2665646 RepID=UPI0018E81DE1|nr:hypothetical protein [Alicyclobacillus sp. SO9]QQE79255.1 hypothetical protein GI364_01715 [Alicyclobacillus sp. SO9]